MPTPHEDEELERDIRGSYAVLSTAAKQRASATGVAQRIGKLVLRFVGGNSRNQNALRQMCSVNLSNQHSSESLGRSIRECGQAVLRENAEQEQFALNKLEESDSDAKVTAAIDEHRRNQAIRAVLSRGLRTDADEQDIARCTRALSKLEAEDGEEYDDEGAPLRAYREEA